MWWNMERGIEVVHVNLSYRSEVKVQLPSLEVLDGVSFMCTYSVYLIYL